MFTSLILNIIGPLYLRFIYVDVENILYIIYIYIYVYVCGCGCEIICFWVHFNSNTHQQILLIKLGL
jgi:hypothetical protein